jgi:hypothetical protein
MTGHRPRPAAAAVDGGRDLLTRRVMWAARWLVVVTLAVTLIPAGAAMAAPVAPTATRTAPADQVTAGSRVAADPGGAACPPAEPHTPAGASGSGAAGPAAGVFDVPGQIRQAVTGWLTQVAASALDPVLGMLGCTVLATPKVTDQDRVRQLWAHSAVIANTLFVLFVLAGGVLVMTRDTLQTRYGFKQVAPRIVVAFVAANTSLLLAGIGIDLANALSAGIAGQGVDPAGVWTVLKAILTGPGGQGLVAGQPSIVLVLGAIVVAVLALAVLITYLVRIAVTVLLVVAAPFMLACHAHPTTEPVAFLWWRALAGCLAIQVAQTLTLLVAVQVFFDRGAVTAFGLPSMGGLIDLMVAGCLLVILIRIPTWVTRMILHTSSRSRVAGIIRTVVIFRTLGALGLAGRGAGTAGGLAATHRGPGPGRPPGGGSGPHGRPGGPSRPGRPGPGTGPGRAGPRRPGRGGPPPAPTGTPGGPAQGPGGHTPTPAATPPTTTTTTTTSGSTTMRRPTMTASARPRPRPSRPDPPRRVPTDPANQPWAAHRPGQRPAPTLVPQVAGAPRTPSRLTTVPAPAAATRAAPPRPGALRAPAFAATTGTRRAGRTTARTARRPAAGSANNPARGQSR